MARQSQTIGNITTTITSIPGTEHADQDRSWIGAVDGRPRVCVVDGVTPWRAPSFGGLDAGAFAADTVVRHLATAADVVNALERANAELHDHRLVPSRRQPMAVVVCADINVRGDMLEGLIVTAGDCECWAVDAAGDLALIAGGDHLTPGARERWDAARADLGKRGASFDAILEAEATYLDDPDTQRTFAIGRYPSIRLAAVRALANGFVLASDGACLAEAVTRGTSLETLDDHLSEVARKAVRDDLTCVTVSVT